MAEWVTVGKADEVAEGEAKAFDVNGAADRGRPCRRQRCYAFSDICTHRQCNLALGGEIDGTTIECECHGSMFEMTPARSCRDRRPSRSHVPRVRRRRRAEDRGLRALVTDRTFVIVGASLAGATAAATLRDGGLRRPARADRRRAARPRTSGPRSPRSTCAASRRSKSSSCAPSSGTATTTSTRGSARAPCSSMWRGREVVLAGGERVAFDALLVATGSRNRKLDVPGRRPARRLRPAHTPAMPSAIKRSRRRRRAGRLRGHGVHRRRGRRLAAHARPRRHGRRGLRDHPVPGARPRHRPGARRAPPRPRGADAVQRGGGELRGRRTARSRRHRAADVASRPTSRSSASAPSRASS